MYLLIESKILYFYTHATHIWTSLLYHIPCRFQQSFFCEVQIASIHAHTRFFLFFFFFFLQIVKMRTKHREIKNRRKTEYSLNFLRSESTFSLLLCLFVLVVVTVVNTPLYFSSTRIQRTHEKKKSQSRRAIGFTTTRNLSSLSCTSYTNPNYPKKKERISGHFFRFLMDRCRALRENPNFIFVSFRMRMF